MDNNNELTEINSNDKFLFIYDIEKNEIFYFCFINNNAKIFTSNPKISYEFSDSLDEIVETIYNNKMEFKDEENFKQFIEFIENNENNIKIDQLNYLKKLEKNETNMGEISQII